MTSLFVCFASNGQRLNFNKLCTCFVPFRASLVHSSRLCPIHICDVNNGPV